MSLEQRVRSGPPTLGTTIRAVASFVRISIVIEARHGAEGIRHLDRFLDRAKVTVVPMDLEQRRLARQAFSRFVKGRHEAGPNFGDCSSCALAQVLGDVPVLAAS